MLRLNGIIDAKGEMPVIPPNRYNQIDNMGKIRQRKSYLLRFLLQNIRKGVQQQLEQHVIMRLGLDILMREGGLQMVTTFDIP